MTEEKKLPFFINTKRLQREDDYFGIGRTPTPDKLRRLLEARQSPSQESLEVGDYEVDYYGSTPASDQFVSDEEEEEGDDTDSDKIGEDVKYHTKMFSVVWMAFKNVAACFGDPFSKSSNINIFIL